MRVQTELKIWLVAFVVCVCGLAYAAHLHTFSSNEALTASKLNANFAHLEASAARNHGAVIVNADISANAAIAHSKLQVPGLMPKAWAVVNNCTTATCTVPEASSRISGVTRSAAGTYTVSFSPALGDVDYAVSLTHMSGTAGRFCSVTTYGTTSFGVLCYNVPGAALVDSGFGFVVMDNDP